MKISELRKVLDIIERQRGPDSWPIAGADHDVVFFEIDSDKLTEEDKATLESVGVFFSDEYDCWIMYT